MNVSDYIFDTVSKYTDTVFFLPGGGSMFLVDALGRNKKLNHIAMLHEAGAGGAALGHAQARKGLGVCCTTSGPGSTNAITACLAAWTDSIPVLFISGTPNSNTLIGDTGLRIRGVQEVDIISLVKNITKIAIRLMIAKDVSFWMEKLIDGAKSSRQGPVWLDVPLDIQGAKYEQ